MRYNRGKTFPMWNLRPCGKTMLGEREERLKGRSKKHLWCIPADEPAWSKYKDLQWDANNQRGPKDAQIYAAMVEMVDRKSEKCCSCCASWQVLRRPINGRNINCPNFARGTSVGQIPAATRISLLGRWPECCGSNESESQALAVGGTATCPPRLASEVHDRTELKVFSTSALCTLKFGVGICRAIVSIA